MVLQTLLLSVLKPFNWLMSTRKESDKTSMKGVDLMTANQIAYWNYVENSRHNRASEQEATRSNKVREHETFRSNVAQENLGAEKNRLQRELNTINANYNLQHLTETQRHNRAQEELDRIGNTIRAQQVDVSYAQLENARRIAQINAGPNYAAIGATYASIAEQQRSNMAREAENTRHNIEQEATANRNVSVGRQQAKAAQGSAQARLKEADLHSAQWYDPTETAKRKQERTYNAEKINNLVQNTNLQAQQTQESKSRTVANIMNAISNAFNSGSSAVKTLGGVLQ